MNMKRFIIEPVVFALGWLSFGFGSALSRVNQKVVSGNAVITESLNLGSAKSGDRWYFIVNCTGQCKDTSLTVRGSGGPHLYVAIGNLPLRSFPGGCTNCLCEAVRLRVYNKCNLKKSLNFSSFGVLVQADAYLMNTKLKIKSRNVEGIKEIPIHSKRWDSLKQGEIRNFKVTCNGTCSHVTVWVRGTSPRKEQAGLITGASQIPVLCLAYNLYNVIGTGIYCRHNICGRWGYSIDNSCAFVRLDEDSFVASLTPLSGLKGVKFSVVGLNVIKLIEL